MYGPKTFKRLNSVYRVEWWSGELGHAVGSLTFPEANNLASKLASSLGWSAKIMGTDGRMVVTYPCRR